MSSLVALQVKGNRPTDVGERDERENEKGYNALPLSSAAGSIQNEDGSGHPAIPEDCVLGIRSSIEQAEVGRRPIVRRKQTQKEKFGVTVLFPLALEILLFLTSAAQYTGASGISLTVVLTLNYSPIATNNFWMYMGFVGWFSPLIGWISDVFTIREERRRPCLAIGILGDAVCLLCIGLYAPQLHPAGFIALCLAQTAFEMMVFVPLNALVVELSKNRSLVRRRKETPSVWKRIAALSIWRKLKTKCSCCLLNLTDICITPASALSGQGGMASVSQLGSEQTTPSGSERATLFQIVTPGGNGSGGEGDGRVGVEAAGECRGHPHDFSESTGYDRSNSSISKDGSMLFRVLPPAGTGSGNGTASSGGTQTPGRGQSISTSTFQVQFASSLTGIPREVAGGAGAGGGGTGGGGGVDLSTAGPLPLPRQHASPVALSGYHGPLNQSTTSANSIMNSSADSRRALREDVECYHLPPE